MSELIIKTENRTAIRWKLLAGASAVVLASYLSSAEAARASGADRPTVWIELNGQFANQSADQEAFLPPFVLASPFGEGEAIARKYPPSEWDEGGKITFEPAGSDWVVSLGVRYGKSRRRRVSYQYTKHRGGYYNLYYSGYQNSVGSTSEKHVIVDFQVGKDIGLGRFGSQGTSTFSLGVRYAKFDSKSTTSIKSVTARVPTSYYIFNGSFAAQRKFIGIGPSLSWDASANIVGNASAGALTFDWGLNGALLFGRQRMKGHHEKTALYQQSSAYYGPPKTVVYQTAKSPARNRTVTVPNFGGFAAISLRYPNAKISLGYRADLFFGAIDGGIDTAKSYDRNFYGPFAAISIGLGG